MKKEDKRMSADPFVNVELRLRDELSPAVFVDINGAVLLAI